MARKIASCYNCVFAYLDPEITLWCFTTGFLNWPACANHPQSYGRMKRTPRCGICSNYRSKPETPEGDVRQIALGDGFTAYVDAKDYEWLSRWTWYLHGGYAIRREKNKVIYMHREIMKPPNGVLVDHKNRNKLDNTRDNLRHATRQENARNHPKRRGSSSRFRGVSYIRTRRRHRAAIRYEGKLISCGYFVKEIEAARAHDAKAVELHGEFAQLNFPDEWPPQRRAQVYAQGDATRRKIEARAREKKAAKNTPRKTPAARRTTKPKRASQNPKRRNEPRMTESRPRNTRSTRKERHLARRRRGAKGGSSFVVTP